MFVEKIKRQEGVNIALKGSFFTDSFYGTLQCTPYGQDIGYTAHLVTRHLISRKHRENAVRRIG